MAELAWDQVGDRFYESGVAKGVLYQEDRSGVPWNGLVAVEEGGVNEVEPIFFDGVKFNDLVTLGDFAGIIRAFTYPEEFLRYEGALEDQSGFYVKGQPPKRFCMSYQTLIGDDVGGSEVGYNIHVLYNLTAVPSQKIYETLSLDTAPVEFEWNVSSIPENIIGYQPTAHIVFNSLKIDPFLLQDIEDILYGSEDNDAYLPSLQSLATFIRKWDRLIVIDNGDGTWTATSSVPGVITMLDDDTFQIDSDTAVFIDADSYTLESSEKNEEDIWLP